MKILCVADHIDPLVYSTHAKERFKDISLVLGAGDLPMEYLGYISSVLNKPIYFVFGNHNLKGYHYFKRPPTMLNRPLSPDHYFADDFGSTYIGGKVVKTKGGILIAGMGGSILYNGEENQYTDSQMFWKLLRLVPRLILNKLRYGRYLDIFLTHAPPRHLGDREDPPHQGFKWFRWFLERFKPRYMLHGHVHLYEVNEPRIIDFHETRIINVYNHYVLELPEQK